ncbi:aminopeptidase N [Citricoccus sp.]|uniref:aminopeptidase N n=1 Tax=Citricoccus sp. TaxID=1978372 RepID=UPI002C068A7C|nr:aminopeptidase N [Citricoccus sp.]HRO92837.1 aminopeptidase N [Citricoccus sp.]
MVTTPTAEPAFLDRTNLTREEARERSALVTVHDYDVHVDLGTALDAQATGFRTRTSLTFSCADPGSSTFLDFIHDGVESVVLNGRCLDTAQVCGGSRILLPDLAGSNEVTVVGTALYSTSGEGLHRFVDPSDGRTYLYTQYEPADARRVFATFEQPDLKGRFTFHLTGPADWVLASNQPEAARRDAGEGLVTVDFSPTPPMSTYITTLLAGPYAVWEDRWDGHPGSGAPVVPLSLYCRRSMAGAMDAERVFDTTRAGLDHFHDLFRVPYPWGRYGQAFVPEYNLGAMENPGLVTLTEDYVFSSRATRAQYEGRATTIMHEMAHMWFGDLVTMRWWDDLWLKESFADYMGTLAVAEATEFTDAWTTFAHRRKGWAYVQDQYPTTHPIVADIADLEAARQNFDGITYAKGASVLKQLVAFVGREAFMAASREYFARHAWGNAALQDFLAVLEEVSGRDLADWPVQWLQTAGVPELWVRDGETPVLCQRGTDPATGRQVLRPHVLRVGRYAPDDGGRLVRTAVTDVEVASGATGAHIAAGGAAGHEAAGGEGAGAVRLVLPNDEDLTYAKIRLDPASVAAVLEHPVTDSLAAATVWAALWNMTRDGLLPAADFVGACCRLSGHLEDVGLYSQVLGQAETAIRRYAPAGVRTGLRVRFGAALREALSGSGSVVAGSDRQRAAMRVFALLARGAADAGDAGDAEDADHDAVRGVVTVLESVLAGWPGGARPAGDGTAEGGRAAVAPGLEVDAEMRWAALQALAALGRADQDRLDRALAAEVTAQTAVWHRTASAAVPEARVREQAWTAVITGRTADGRVLSNDHLSAVAAGFTASRPDLAAPFTPRYWPELTGIWTGRSNGLASRTIGGLFPAAQDALPGGPDAQDAHPVVAAARAWLAEHPEAPRALRRIVVERTDDLVRSLRVQAAGR